MKKGQNNWIFDTVKAYEKYVLDDGTVITNNGKNVYINGKVIFIQYSYGYAIHKKVWNANKQYWEEWNFHEIQKPTNFQYSKNIVVFCRTLFNFPLQQYVESTNCEGYIKAKSIFDR